MTVHKRSCLRGIVQLGSGELLQRAFSVAVIVLLGHLYGVVIVGIYSLAGSVSQYLMPIIDFGQRHVGARLVARFPNSSVAIMQQVQGRRLRLALATLPFILLYAAVAHLAFELKVFLFLFAGVTALYSISLDWVAWGSGKLFLVGMGRSVVPGCVLLALIIAIRSGHLLSWLVAGNLIGFCLQGLIFGLWWQHYRRQLSRQDESATDITDALQWRRTSIMGLAWLSNLAFNTVDMLMLGVMSSPKEVGLYSASYRMLNQFLVTYYLFTNSLFPYLARQGQDQRRRTIRLRNLLLLFACGIVIATIVALFRRPLLSIAFGPLFEAAAPLLLVLACCIPLDFVTSYLSNAYIAWSMERSVLVCVGLAAICNIGLNLGTIPRYGARAAAVNTLISYFVFLAGLLVMTRSLRSTAKFVAFSS